MQPLPYPSIYLYCNYKLCSQRKCILLDLCAKVLRQVLGFERTALYPFRTFIFFSIFSFTPPPISHTTRSPSYCRRLSVCNRTMYLMRARPAQLYIKYTNTVVRRTSCANRRRRRCARWMCVVLPAKCVPYVSATRHCDAFTICGTRARQQ